MFDQLLGIEQKITLCFSWFFEFNLQCKKNIFKVLDALIFNHANMSQNIKNYFIKFK